MPRGKGNLVDAKDICEKEEDCVGVSVLKCQENSVNNPGIFGICTEYTNVDRNQDDCSYYKIAG